jgi:hypothetical protein
MVIHSLNVCSTETSQYREVNKATHMKPIIKQPVILEISTITAN